MCSSDLTRVSGSALVCNHVIQKRKNVNEMDYWTGAHLELAKCSCPYCGAPIQLVIDPQQVGAQYVEDCEVCCRPMLVTALSESEVICDIEG
mgnify:CR=1 FL=1